MTPEDFLRLAASGMTAEQIAMVMEIVQTAEASARAAAEAALETGREKGRERWRRWDEKRRSNVSQREQTLGGVSKHSRGGVTRVEDKTSKPDIEPHSENKKRELALAGFDVWYAGYPHKVQRGAAERAWSKAISLASLPELIAGRDRYIASKPVDRPWQNPATWLNGKGWLDQPANVVPMARGSPRPIEDLIDHVIDRMGNFDANATAETQGYQAAPLRLPGR